MKRRLTCVAAMLALAASASACGTGANAEGILRATDPGTASQVRLKPTTSWTVLTQGASIPAGAEVRTGRDGFATLAASGGSFSLAPSTWIQITSSHEVIAKTGGVLAESKGTSLTVSDGDQRLALGDSGSAYRFDYGSRIADYRGWVHTTVTGEHENLWTGQELTIGLASQTPHMLVLDQKDPWDKRLLADAIEIDDRLAPYRATFDVNTGGGPATIEFLTNYAPASQIEFLRPVLANHLKSEKKFDVLVTLLIALENARTPGISLGKSFASTQGLLDAGATFGLAAYVLGVNAHSLVQDVLTALSPHTPGVVVPTSISTAQPPGGGGGTTQTPTPSSQTSPTPTQSSTNSPSPTPTPTQTHSSTPSPTPSPSSSCSVVDQLTGKCKLAPA